MAKSHLILSYFYPPTCPRTLKNSNLPSWISASASRKFDSLTISLSEELDIKSKHDEITCELIRGIRLHYPKFLKGEHTSQSRYFVGATRHPTTWPRPYLFSVTGDA